jgi:hypothetical protein
MAKTDSELAEENFSIYESDRDRGHVRYTQKAKRNEGFFFGDGDQWSDADREVMEASGRRAFEFNEIQETIKSALGFQLQNRVDITFVPRGGGATQDVATTLSKVVRQISDNNDYRWLESQVFADGLIEQRGYFEMRMNFDDSMLGEIRISHLDPRDVIPDPDAKHYDPDKWDRVTVTRWMTLDEIEALYGKKKRSALESAMGGLGQFDFGADGHEAKRNTFAGEDDLLTGANMDILSSSNGQLRVRIIDRQQWRLASAKVAVYPTGDVRVVENISDEKRAQAEAAGAIFIDKVVRRVRWIVTASSVVLFDDWSPYEHFTVIPYFPIFRRGRTQGMVDNAIGPQEMANKALSSYVHIVNSTANSGWVFEEDSLTNMTPDELVAQGSQSGIGVEYKKGATAPQKIQPNRVPDGIQDLMLLGFEKIRAVTGQNRNTRGEGGDRQSGVAVQAQQFASQLSAGPVLDNLSFTRTLLARRMLKLIQTYMDDPRIIRIQEPGEDGVMQDKELPVNFPEQQKIINDLTLGEYGVIIAEQPSQVTFENGQFEQAKSLRDLGIDIPEDVLIRHSNLVDKGEIIERMRAKTSTPDPVDTARERLIRAQAANKQMASLKLAAETSEVLASNPALAPMADIIAKSAGFEDQDKAPVFPSGGQPSGNQQESNNKPPDRLGG